MNENSSKYVDTIATEKLLKEKLQNVSHDPDQDRFSDDCKFNDFVSLKKKPDGLNAINENKFSFKSPLSGPYLENNRVPILVYPAPQSRGSVIFVHGLYEDNLEIYLFFIRQLNKQDIDVYLMILPYHYDRQPAESQFSGEFFFSAHLKRSAMAFKQAIYELYQLYHFLKMESGQRVLVSGFSMGGGIVLALAGLTALDSVFAINPVCQIGTLVWDSVLFSTIKRDLERRGRELADVQNQFAHFEPMNVSAIETAINKVAMVWGLYDQINQPENYRKLIRKWGFKNTIPCKAGHLNILRVPRLAADLAEFYFNGKLNELL